MAVRSLNGGPKPEWRHKTWAAVVGRADAGVGACGCWQRLGSSRFYPFFDTCFVIERALVLERDAPLPPTSHQPRSLLPSIKLLLEELQHASGTLTRNWRSHSQLAIAHTIGALTRNWGSHPHLELALTIGDLTHNWRSHTNGALTHNWRSHSNGALSHNWSSQTQVELSRTT